MRLFIALNFGRQVEKSLHGAIRDLQKSGVQGRYTPFANLHLTLAFIGEQERADAAIRAMERVHFAPCSLTLSGSGHFGQLLWAGVEDNPELEALAGELRQALAAEGVPFDPKPFSPHITLVRRARWGGEDRDIPVRVRPVRMQVREISLMVSEPVSEGGRSGVRYRVLYTLRAQEPDGEA